MKAAVATRAQDLVDTVLTPRYVREPPPDPQWNYIVGLSTRWYRSSLYFCAIYCCPGPNALSPSFEQRFARMEFAGENRFHLAYMRHTGAWVVLNHDLPLEECLIAIRDGPWFQMASLHLVAHPVGRAHFWGHVKLAAPLILLGRHHG